MWPTGTRLATLHVLGCPAVPNQPPPNCCAGPEADGQQGRAVGAHPAAPGHRPLIDLAEWQPTATHVQHHHGCAPPRAAAPPVASSAAAAAAGCATAAQSAAARTGGSTGPSAGACRRSRRQRQVGRRQPQHLMGLLSRRARCAFAGPCGVLLLTSVSFNQEFISSEQHNKRRGGSKRQPSSATQLLSAHAAVSDTKPGCRLHFPGCQSSLNEESDWHKIGWA